MMRRVLLAAAAALTLLAVQAQAQTTPATTPAPAATTPPATTPPITTPPASTTAPAKKMSRHVTLQQRFDTANTSHDGHLTKDQATAANWPYVANNFVAMDKDKKGFVTIGDIRAYAKARRAAHKVAPAPAPKPASNG